jgi:hypothetical protein
VRKIKIVRAKDLQVAKLVPQAQLVLSLELVPMAGAANTSKVFAAVGICELLVSGSALPAQCGPRAGSHLPVESSRCKIPLRNSRGAPEFDFLSTLSLTVGYLATFGARDAKAFVSPVC